MSITIEVNGNRREVRAAPDTPLLWALRDQLNLVGTKFGCGAGLCGACTVHLDGAPPRACQTSLEEVGQRKVTTIEGIGATQVGTRLQDAWIKLDVAQCGYCQAGQIMSAAALLASNPRPSDEEVVAAMNGNLCRCATYHRIKAAIRSAAGAR